MVVENKFSLDARMSSTKEIAETYFGQEVTIEELGTCTYKIWLTQDQRYAKARILGLSSMDIWVHKQLTDVPAIIDIVDGVKFVEWWEGEQFPEQHDDIAKLPTEWLYQYGEWLKKAKWRGIYPKDDSWKNVLHCPDRNLTINCDLHGLISYKTNYMDILKCCLSEEHWAAVCETYQTTKMDIQQLVVDMGWDGFWGGHHYQPINVKDICVAGSRSYQRLDMIGRESLEGKRILDLGCSLGMMCYNAAERGAEYVLGVDNDGEAPYHRTVLLQAIADYAGYDQISFLPFSLDEDLFYEYACNMHFDICYCFAVHGHVKDSVRMMGFVDSHCDELFFEGRLSQSAESTSSYVEDTTTFRNGEYLGESSTQDDPPCVRHLFHYAR